MLDCMFGGPVGDHLLFTFQIFKIYLLILEGGGEKKREKHQFVIPLTYPFIGCFLYTPWPEIEPTTSAYQDKALRTELPGQGCLPNFLLDKQKGTNI